MQVDIRQYIPKHIRSGIKGNTYPLEITEKEHQYLVSYVRPVANHTGSNVGLRCHKGVLPKSMVFDQNTFEVIGLLQGEMSKTLRKTLTFANCKPEIMNRVLDWFDSQFHVHPFEWNWYVRLNIARPSDNIEHLYYCQQLISYWYGNCVLSYYKQNPTVVSYVRNTKNLTPKNYGTLMIEHAIPIFVQTVQKLVRDVTFSMPDRSPEEIIAYMRGIIAAEGCINFELKTGHRRVFITATVEEERAIFRACLRKLGIQTQDCKPIKDIVISRKENVTKLHELGLVTLNPDKHERFLEMVDSFVGRWPKSL